MIISTCGTISSIRRNEKRVIKIGSDCESSHGQDKGKGSRARFTKITGFVQIKGTSTIIAVDSWNHCLRNISLVNNEFYSETFAGKCTHSGSDDGHMKDEARFNRPYKIIEGYCQNEYYVTDHYNYAIRLIVLKNSSVVTITNLENWGKPRAIALDRSAKTLLVSVENEEKGDSQLIRLNTTNNSEPAHLKPSMPALGTVKSIITLRSYTYLVSDWGKEHQWLLTLGENKKPQKIADIDSPYSLALSKSKDKCKLYVGGRGFIKVLTVKGM